MYVSTCKGGANGQYTYVRLMESYRDENGKVKHKVVQNLGRLDILSQSDPNYLENLKKKYQEDFAEKSRLQSLNRLAQVQSLLSFDNNSSAGAPFPLLQYGHYPFKKDLGRHLHWIESSKTSAQANKSEIRLKRCRFLPLLLENS